LLRGTLLLLLLRARSLRTVALLILLLLLLSRALSVASALSLSLLVASAAAGTLLLALLARAAGLAGAGALLELADLLLHVAARLRVLPGSQLAVAAVGAPLPSFGVGSLAACAEDGFRERHRKSARIVHFGPWMKTGAAPCWR
jgi:hypothetical protein